ncbi:MAG: sugar transferase [Oscillospiraceae bacterium]|jgi:lipopolysaccharide/colanic/teichoic acid biosynthesis glycosyltransferase|nr:sugar transferase [Oscillospiraceae bacterium]
MNMYHEPLPADAVDLYWGGEGASRQFEEEMAAKSTALEELAALQVDARVGARHAYLFAKRAMDIAMGVVGFILLLISLPFVAVAIKLDTKGPVFFAQKRIGKDGKPFTMFKYRSMTVDADQMKASLLERNEREGPVFKIADDPRVTRVGAFLRKTCIDELPQFINVLLGDMSIVGPRPPLPEEVAQYKRYQRQRLAVKPGITCYWQVMREQAPTFDDWVRMDIEYINKRSLAVDIGMVFRTFGVILGHKGHL